MTPEEIYRTSGWETAEEVDLQPFLETQGLAHNQYEKNGHVLCLAGIAPTFRAQLLPALLHLFLRVRMDPQYFMRAYITEANYLLDFLRQSRYPQDFEEAQFLDAFLQYRRRIPKIARKKRSPIANIQDEYLAYFSQPDAPQYRQIWQMDALHLPWFKYNPAIHAKQMDFRPIPLEENRRIIQEYLWHLTMHERITMMSVYSRFSGLRCLAIYFREASLLSIGRSAFEEFLAQTCGEASAAVYNFRITTYRRFYTYCIQRGLCKEYPIPFSLYARRTGRVMRYEGISDHVLQQIMEHLGALPEDVALIFLIVYYTGAYAYQACSLKVDGLVRIKGQPHLRFPNNERQKEVFTPIPEELAKLVQKQRKSTLKDHPDARFLFLSSDGRTYRSIVVQKAINALCIAQDICQEDGSRYVFSFRQLRHAYAYRLVRHHTPPLTIQKLMHHRTVDMALCYQSMEEERQKDQYLAFYDLRGRKLDALDEESRAIDDNLLWMRHMIQQALPNGYCSLPIHVGTCPHANACLSCESFRTTVEFLPVLRYQLVKIERLMQMEDTPAQVGEVAARLQHLIAVLEEEVHHARELAK